VFRATQEPAAMTLIGPTIPLAPTLSSIALLRDVSSITYGKGYQA
jgi:hypothetical protein